MQESIYATNQAYTHISGWIDEITKKSCVEGTTVKVEMEKRCRSHSIKISAVGIEVKISPSTTLVV